MKPKEYRKECAVIRDIDYQVEGGQLQGTQVRALSM
jgi:hypothetical protein